MTHGARTFASRTALSAGDRRALWLGVLLVAPVLLWRVVVSPLNTALARADERAAQGRELLARERIAIREAPALPAQLADLRARAKGESSRLFGATDTVAAAAALANWVRNTAGGAGLRNVQMLAAPGEAVAGNVHAVSVDVRAEGDFAAVANWLDLLLSGERALVVDRLDLAASPEAAGSVALGARVRGFVAPFTPAQPATRGRRP